MKCYVMRPFSDQCHEQQQQQQHHAVMWRASLMDTSRQKSIPYTVNSVLSITYGEYVPEVSEIVFFISIAIFVGDQANHSTSSTSVSVDSDATATAMQPIHN